MAGGTCAENEGYFGESKTRTKESDLQLGVAHVLQSIQRCLHFFQPGLEDFLAVVRRSDGEAKKGEATSGNGDVGW